MSLGNCSCASYSLSQIECLLWGAPLVNLHQILSGGYNLYLKLPVLELCEHPFPFLFYLSIHPSIYLSSHLSICLSIYLSIYVSIYHLSIYRSTYLPIYLSSSSYQSMHLSSSYSHQIVWVFFVPSDNMLFINEFTWLFMQIKALIILIVCMLSYFKYISIILYNFMLWSKNTSIYGLLYIIKQMWF